MKKKNILLVSFDFSLENGGIQNTGYLLAQYLSKYYDVTTFCNSNGNKPEIEGVHSYKSKYKSRNKFLPELISLHKKHHFDFALSTSHYDSISLLMLKKMYQVPYGIMAHGNELLSRSPSGFKEKWDNYIFSHLRRILLNNADLICSNTNFTKQLIEKISSNTNIVVIHPPISMMPICHDENNKSKVLLTVCRLAKRKGCQNVIKALPRIIEKYPQIKYLIAGSGSYEKELRMLTSELGLDDHVIFKGFITEEEKKYLYRTCGLFVMPSIRIDEEQSVEGFGISLVEANCFGKFVITSISGGIPEAVIDGETGFLVKEGDIEGLSTAVIRFYDSSFRYSATKCMEWAKEHHISNIVIQYKMAIDGIVGQSECER